LRELGTMVVMVTEFVREASMEFEGSKSAMIPEGVYIIGTYDENGVPNAMNAAWGVQSDYSQITFFLGKHKTTQNLQVTGAFTVAFGTADTVAISDYFGIDSGAKVNKIERAGVHVHKAPHVNAPVIEEYPVTMECTVASYDPNTGVLVGEVVNEIADDSVITDGHVDLGKLRPIVLDYAAREYRVVGESVGSAWHDGLSLR
jgi:flavin reductase (DIM6/NTAB) family NADH-FMN oxidoreductase RutF